MTKKYANYGILLKSKIFMLMLFLLLYYYGTSILLSSEALDMQIIEYFSRT